jgi:hypothetical protein
VAKHKVAVKGLWNVVCILKEGHATDGALVACHPTALFFSMDHPDGLLPSFFDKEVSSDSSVDLPEDTLPERRRRRVDFFYIELPPKKARGKKTKKRLYDTAAVRAMINEWEEELKKKHADELKQVKEDMCRSVNAARNEASKQAKQAGFLNLLCVYTGQLYRSKPSTENAAELKQKVDLGFARFANGCFCPLSGLCMCERNWYL